MILMLDTPTEIEQCATESGCVVEQLFTPCTRYRNRHPERHFAIDNGAFSKKGFDRKAFEALLKRESVNRARCRFVAVPDVVGSARRTLEVFHYWQPFIGDWPLAYVCQDGQEDQPIPWEHIDAIFIGGSTRFKESESAIQCLRAAKAMSKWVHIGRINDPARFHAFEILGADSCDGTGLARYTWMRERIRREPPMFSREELTNVDYRN